MAQTGDTISVQCGCGKKLKAPSTAVGKRAKCPACGNVLTIELPPPPPAEDDPLGAMYDLAEAEKAASTNAAEEGPRCPKCGSELAAGSVLCVNCGYDLRSGKKATTIKAAPVAAAPGKGKPLAYAEKEERPPAEGNYFMGILFGLLFAAGGAAVSRGGHVFPGRRPLPEPGRAGACWGSDISPDSAWTRDTRAATSSPA